jgi:hypothetical protein
MYNASQKNHGGLTRLSKPNVKLGLLSVTEGSTYGIGPIHLLNTKYFNQGDPIRAFGRRRRCEQQREHGWFISTG